MNYTERSVPFTRIIEHKFFEFGKDSETGESAWVNTSSRKVRSEYSKWFASVADNETKLFNRYQIDSVDIATDDDYVKGLMAFFGRR